MALACVHIEQNEFTKGAKKTYVKLLERFKKLILDENEDIRVKKVSFIFLP
jgi:hypothetical protein